MPSDPRGALWHKWDLHVHTPESLVHSYPGAKEEAWVAFLDDLEALPDEVKVIGINDYLFVDGYERVIKEKDSGRLTNIDLILPVVELRLNVYGGTESGLSRANYHVIFSDEVPPSVIRDQFIRALASEFQLNPRYAATHLRSKWSGVISEDALENLGKAIIASVPADQRIRYDSAKVEGFNNLTVPLARVQERLRSQFFRHAAITAVGKTEWADIKWKDGSIADKKNIVNSADCLFVAAASPPAHARAREALIEGGVNARLLDCSDAHHLSSSAEKDRLGNCFTWIKADRTFAGLLQALQEYENRVFVGPEPPQHLRVAQHPSRYLDRLKVSRNPGSKLTDRWFDVDLPLSSGLVAVIGNKGSGKSALAEILGVTCGSGRHEHFSFLTGAKFQDRRQRLSSEFTASTTWCDGEVRDLALDEVPDGQNPLVQHLPQRYLEQLCTEIPRGAKTEFDFHLERIIFSHLPTEEQLGTNSVGDLAAMLQRPLETRLEELRGQLRKTNAEIAELEESLTRAERRERQALYHRRRKEWWELKQSPPQEVGPPDEDDPSRVALRTRIRELAIARSFLASRRDAIKENLALLRRDQSDLEAFRSNMEALQRQHSILLGGNEVLLKRLGLETEVSTFTLDTDALSDARARLANAEGEMARELDENNDQSLPSAIDWVQEKSRQLQGSLSGASERYEEYLARKEAWEQAVAQALGTSDDPDSLLGSRATLMELRQVPARLDDLKRRRQECTREIHAVLCEQATKHAALYRRLERFMADQSIREEYVLSVGTGLVDTGLAETLLDTIVNRNAAGSYCGVPESAAVVSHLLDQTDFYNADDVVDLVEALTERLHRDFRTPTHPETDIHAQLRKGVEPVDAYNLIFGLEYLSARFGLEFGGKPIYRLSPGEKGTLLLIFFLLADLDHRPLIVDQPEDNLDNQTVYRALVGCFHKAKERRQVVVVTHNPNLAVVCDADQIIVASMSSMPNTLIEYDSGAIEAPRIVRAIVDILEGTQPAFENRSLKYALHRYGAE